MALGEVCMTKEKNKKVKVIWTNIYAFCWDIASLKEFLGKFQVILFM